MELKPEKKITLTLKLETREELDTLKQALRPGVPVERLREILERVDKKVGQLKAPDEIVRICEEAFDAIEGSCKTYDGYRGQNAYLYDVVKAIENLLK